MKNTNKAFTLVELIVVITILAILGTIAFISLQGYSQDAKNAKVGQDLNSLASAIEVGLTKGTISLANINDGSLTTAGTNEVSSSKTITYKDNNGDDATGALDNSAVKYQVGKINFAQLRQNGDDFKDPEKKDYIIATAYTGSTFFYQLGGQTKDQAGDYTFVAKGNYVQVNATSDADGLIAKKDNTPTDGLTNGTNLGTTGLY